MLKIGGVDTVGVNQATEERTSKQAELLLENGALCFLVRRFTRNIAQNFYNPALECLCGFRSHYQMPRSCEKLGVSFAQHFTEIGFVAGFVHPPGEQVFSRF